MESEINWKGFFITNFVLMILRISPHLLNLLLYVLIDSNLYKYFRYLDYIENACLYRIKSHTDSTKIQSDNSSVLKSEWIMSN